MVLFYVFPSPIAAIVIAALGVLLFAAFGLYLLLLRRQESGSLGSSIPTLFGPLLAYAFVKFRSPTLWDLLENKHGDVLIQLAFFWAGVLGLIVYHMTTIRTLSSSGVSERHSMRANVSFLFIVGLLLITAFAPDFAPIGGAGGPTILGLEAPPLTPLTVARFVLTLWSVILATWPSSPIGAVSDTN